MAAALREFPGPVLLILSGDDLTAKEFLEYAHSGPGWQWIARASQGSSGMRSSWRGSHVLERGAAGEVEACTLSWLSAVAAIRSR